MKVIAVKLIVEMEFVASNEAEVDKIVKRHADYLGIVSKDKPNRLIYDEDSVLTDGAGNTVTVLSKEVDVGGFE